MMTGEERSQIDEILADSSQPDWLTAARLMEAAFGWLVSSLPPDRLERVQAMKALLALTKSLESLNAGLNTLLPRLTAKAEPGPSLQEAARERQEQLKRLIQEMNQAQKQIGPLVEAEENLRIRAAEFEKLRERLEHLNRLKELAGGVDELKAQLQRMEERLPAEVHEAQQLETKLGAYLENLFILSEQTTAALEENYQKMVRILQQREVELQRISGQLLTAQERYRTVEEEFQERRDVLEFYLEADRIVAEALGEPPSGGMKQLLDHIEHLLQQADQLLKTAMDANQEAKKMTPIPYSSGG